MSFLNAIIPTAYAAAPAAEGHTASPWSSVIFLVVLLAVFYFLMIRPQAKRAKEHRNLVSNLAVGDEVIISGGIIGKISKVEDNFLDVAVADNVNIKVQRSSVSATLPKGTVKQ